jgi:hypothetical protein
VYVPGESQLSVKRPTRRSRVGRFVRQRVGALAAVAALVSAALLGPAGAALASDLLTVNQTAAYVDPSISEEFITVPNLCLEPYNSQATTDGCNELGVRATAAAAGNSPYGDVYFEPAGSFLQATNAFVPNNAGTVNDTGYSDTFSAHKYDLFGRAGDRMGLFTRREILFLEQIPTTGGGITNGQTTPGEDTKLAYIAVLLEQAQGATSVSLGGHTFNYSDMPFYTQTTGFTTGQLTTVTTWCNVNVGVLICGFLTSEQIAQIYAAVNFPNVQTYECGTQQNDLINATNCKNRDQWMDQIVVGYVEAWDSLGGDQHFAQNFRTQVGYDPNATILDSGTQVWADFRLEQSVELSGAHTTIATDPGDVITPGDNMDGIAGRQTFQQAIATVSTQDFGWLFGDNQIGGGIGQLVSQDVNGFFLSCMNCNQNTPGGNVHGFTPAELDLTYQPYSSGWNAVPTIVHGGG